MRDVGAVRSRDDKLPLLNQSQAYFRFDRDLGRQPDQRLEVHLLRDLRAAPVAADVEHPVGRDDQGPCARLTRPLSLARISSLVPSQ